MKPARSPRTWFTTVILAVALLPGCGAALDNISLESKQVLRIYLPPRAQVGEPFAVALDVDAACGEFRRVAIAENGITKTITVDAMFKPPPPGASCIGAIALQRHEGVTEATSEGTYTVEIKGYGGRFTKTLEVTAAPAPAWTPPAFDPADTKPNY